MVTTDFKQYLDPYFILGSLSSMMPKELGDMSKYETEKSRQRLYTQSRTLSTMILSSVCPDRSLSHSVEIFTMVLDKERSVLKAELEEQAKVLQQQEEERGPRPGRRRKNYPKLSKSLQGRISLRPSSLNTARERLRLELVNDLFKYSVVKGRSNYYSAWRGKEVFLVDGTNIRFMDTPELREHFNPSSKDSYLYGTLELVVHRGSGQVYAAQLASKQGNNCERSLLCNLLEEIPRGSMIVGDQLYASKTMLKEYEEAGVDFVFREQEDRRYKVIEVLGDGDEIVEYTVADPGCVSKKAVRGQTFRVRRIQCARQTSVAVTQTRLKPSKKAPKTKDYFLITSILDPRVDSQEIVDLYITRWDIETSIREIKELMGLEFLRPHRLEMAKKELFVGLATYNMIKNFIWDSLEREGLSFPP